jgi:ketosteroid isomerase-like protein
MKQCVLIASMIALVVSGGGPPAAAQSSTDEVEQVLNAFLIPFSNQNVAEFIEYFADDAVVFFPSSRFAAVRVEGKANIRSTFAAVFKPGQPAPVTGRSLIQPQDLKVQRFGDSAIATFHLGSDSARGRRTFVLQRLDSRWKIVHLHASIITQ